MKASAASVSCQLRVFTGLWSELYATMTRETARKTCATDFVATAKARCFETLDGLEPLAAVSARVGS